MTDKSLKEVKQIKPFFVKRKGRFYNRETGKRVSDKYALRINKFLKTNPKKTLYEAQGKPLYKPEKAYMEQSKGIEDIYRKRKNQVIKTKSSTGETVFINPLTNKKFKSDIVSRLKKLDFKDGDFNVSLYRLTTKGDMIEKRIYHRLFTTWGDIENGNQMESFKHIVGNELINELYDLSQKIESQYRIGKKDTHLLRINFNVARAGYSQSDTVNYGYTYSFHVIYNRNLLINELWNMLNKMDAKFHAYLMYQNVRITLSIISRVSNAYPKSIALAENRLSLYR